jgi:predicted ATP-grasp superfamily ATP-dependent carboligase
VKQPLAIVGASTRAAAASAMRAGFQPLAADLFADADLRAIATTTRISPYPEGFVDWMRAIEPPAWMYTGALENHPELVDQLAWIAPLWGNAGEALERVRSPWELAATLRVAGLLFPETRRTNDGLPRDGTWLAKTYRGASGSGVRALGIPLPFREGLGEASDHPTIVFQRRILGTSAAAVFVAADGAATLLGMTRQLIGTNWLNAHGFQYAGSIGPLPVGDATRIMIQKIGDTLSGQFELTGLFGVDMILNDDGPWTIEVNPRYTASVEIVERITGVNAIDLHVAACTGTITSLQAEASSPPCRDVTLGREVASPWRVPSNSARAHGKSILFAKRDVILDRDFVNRAFAESQESPWPLLADISAANDPIEAGRPIFTVFAEGDTDAEVEQRLRERVVELEHRIYGGDAL